MLPFDSLTLVALLGWGTLVGLDLVSVPQMMISRPLVAGAIAGALVGDTDTGIRVGLVVELFALDVLAVGAARYPDYGPATVAAAATAAGAGGDWKAALAPAILVGLLIARLGGWTLPALRHANARLVQRHAAALAAGDSRTIMRIHGLGLAWDLLRSLSLTALGLALGRLLLRWPLPGEHWGPVVAVVGAGLAAAGSGALRSAGRTPRLAWLGAGVVAGSAWVALR